MRNPSMPKPGQGTPCSATDIKGHPCGNYARVGETTCVVHDPNYSGVGAPGKKKHRNDAALVPVANESIADVFRRLMGSKDPEIQMKAARALKDIEGPRTCPVCDARTEEEETNTYFLKVLTLEERQELRSLCETITTFKTTILAEQRPIPVENKYAPESSQEETGNVSAAVPVAAAVDTHAAESGAGSESGSDLPDEPVVLTSDQLKEAGFVPMRGRLVHPLGDEIGDQIKDGRIKFSDAVAQQQTVERERRARYKETK